ETKPFIAPSLYCRLTTVPLAFSGGAWIPDSTNGLTHPSFGLPAIMAWKEPGGGPSETSYLPEIVVKGSTCLHVEDEVLDLGRGGSPCFGVPCFKGPCFKLLRAGCRGRPEG